MHEATKAQTRKKFTAQATNSKAREARVGSIAMRETSSNNTYKRWN